MTATVFAAIPPAPRTQAHCISSISRPRRSLEGGEIQYSNESENCIREHRSGNSEAGNGESYSELQLDSGNVIDVDQNRGSAAVGVDRKHAAKEGVALNDTDCRGHACCHRPKSTEFPVLWHGRKSQQRTRGVYGIIATTLICWLFRPCQRTGNSVDFGL